MADLSTINVTVTGAAGQIGYSLLPEILSGSVFGESTIVNLRLLEITPVLPRLEGVAMELDDLAAPLLGDVKLTDSADEAFDGTDFAFLVGAMPRKDGMDRSDLLEANGKIFVGQGKALNRASKDARILVVGNPANANALIALSNASDLSPRQFSAMSRLDHNRAVSMLASKVGVRPDQIDRLCIWGNHSDTMVPDISNVIVDEQPLSRDVLNDSAWYKEFSDAVAKRGGAVIKARGASSAMSAAHAAANQARDWMNPDNGRWHSMSLLSQGEYGTPEGVVFSFPVATIARGKVKIIEELKIPPQLRTKFRATGAELIEEKQTLQSLDLL